MNCDICDNKVRKIFDAIILKKYPAEYFFCDQCGFLQIKNPIWIQEAYVNPINISDVGYITRNIYLSKKTLILFTLLFGKKNKFLDYAAGHGILVRLMRDYGLDFYWNDLYTQNLFVKGFEHTDQEIKAITCFECFEHFEHPIKEIEKVLKISNNIFFSTLLLPKKIPMPKDWDYYGLDHGQHISFYSIKTLEYIAKKYKLNFYTDGANLHLLTEKKITNLGFKILLFLSKIQLDILIKKLLGSKMEEDFRVIKK